MKTIKTYYGQPILETVKRISAGKEIDFGICRDRNPDCGWGEMHQVNLSMNNIGLKESELDAELKLRLLEDLAYAYGNNTEKFRFYLLKFDLL